MMEFGVRGDRASRASRTSEPGYWEDGTDIARTNIAAFQQLWFDLASAQLGFTGSVKWDALLGQVPRQLQLVLLPYRPASEGWPLFPAYHALACCSRPRARLAGLAGGAVGRRTTGSSACRAAGEGARGLRAPPGS